MVAKRKLAFGTPMGSSRKAARLSTQKKSVAKIARQVVIRMAEKKVAYTSTNQTLLDTYTPGNAWFAMSNIGAGTGVSERSGREICLQKAHIRSTIHNNSNFTMFVRVVLGYFTDDSIPGPTTELFDPITRNGVPITFVTATGSDYILNPTLNKRLFTPVYDKVHKLGTSAVDGANAKQITILKDLKNRKIRFDGVANGNGNQDPTLYLGAWAVQSDNGAIATGNQVEWGFNAAIHYTDL